jgi:hypothetical protein
MDVEWIQLAQYSVLWQLRVNTELKLQIKILIKGAIINSSRRLLLSEASKLLTTQREQFDSYCQWWFTLLTTIRTIYTSTYYKYCQV